MLATAPAHHIAYHPTSGSASSLSSASFRYRDDDTAGGLTLCCTKAPKAMKQKRQMLSLEAHDCANAIPDLSNMIKAVQGQDLKLKCYEEMDKRKKLYNIIQETKGNYQGFFCRCRPLSKDEVSSGQNANGGTTKKTFKFDRVFTTKDDQGIGKTFTMEVNESNRGVNYRTLEELFNIAEERKRSVTYDLSVSVLENQAKKTDINCDATLKSLFGGRDKVGMLEISKLLSPDFPKISKLLWSMEPGMALW
ncbi:hypothetical protein ZEAMMB73_Zm00001d029804 [Zea mays]|uniref:Uncharacterized protein n=1 Tax=Zea mays TaxID=4577 RepID=A0A1D6K7V4_MAIZE|nr:hypothetical protein ZEAMMB73_Zm00001d029804 [Zea mays]